MHKAVLLAVDDSPDNLFLLQQLVEAYLPECELVTAESAQQALELAAARPLDGALIDVELPVTDGIALCRLLKAQEATRLMHILLITSKASTPQLRSVGLAAGADDFISRPIDNAELVAKIRVLLRIQESDKKLLRARDDLETRVAERTADLAQINERLKDESAERQRTAELLAHREYELAARNRIADAFLTLGGDEVYAAVLDIVLEVTQSRHGLFGYIDENGALVCPSLTSEVYALCRMENKTNVFPPETWGQSIWGRSIQTKQALCSNTTMCVPKGHISMTRTISAPVVYQGGTIGAIVVANKEGDYEPADVELLVTLCMKIAPILNARLQRDRHEQQRERAEQALRQAHQDLEQRVERRTAELRLANQQLQSEIAERCKAEEALRESNSLLERVFATTRVLLAYVDKSFNLVRVNHAFAAYDGLAPDDFVGRAFFELYPSSGNEAIFTRVLQTCESASFQADSSIRAGHAGEGSSCWDWSIHPVQGEAGKVEGLLLCLVDVTQREAAELRAHQHQAQLMHVSRMSTMGEMATTIAHELNQPLCAILTTSQATARLLKAAGVTQPAVLEAVDVISAQAKRAGEVIRHMREFTRRRPSHRSTIDLVTLIHEAQQFVAPEAKPHNIKIVLQMPESVPSVLGDTIQIEQVIVNLLKNGVEAMEGASDTPRCIEVMLSRPTVDKVQISVRDAGHGLPPGNVERLFEPFFSTKPEGVGIGLPISRSIIEAHGGRLWAEPGAEGGAVFSFVLPVSS